MKEIQKRYLLPNFGPSKDKWAMGMGRSVPLDEISRNLSIFHGMTLFSSEIE